MVKRQDWHVSERGIRRARKRRDALPCSSRASLQSFNKGKPCISHFRCEAYMTVSHTKDEPLLPLGMTRKDLLDQSFRFPKPAPININHSMLEMV